MLSKLVEKFEFLAAVFYDMEDDPTVEALQTVAAECQQAGIAIVKIRDEEEAKRYGLEEERLPEMLFFHNRVPSLLTGTVKHLMAKN